MLTALRTGLRFRLAVALAAFAALCFVAPPAVLAFGHGKNTVQCLSQAGAVNHGMAKAHHMEDQGSHSPSVADDSNPSDHSAPAGDHQMTCCGLFCLSAVAADGVEIIDLRGPQSHGPAPEVSLFPRGPERLDRPPISLLFV